MKEKIQNIFKDDKKRALVILIIVIIILVILISTVIVISIEKREKEKKLTTTTRLTTTKKANIFKGFETKEFDANKNIVYDLASKHEFIFASGEDKTTIYTFKNDNELLYELTLVDGVIVFSEQKYNTALSAYEFTKKTYSFKGDSAIVDYMVVKTCEQDVYALIAKDKAGNVYLYETPDSEFAITDILNNFKKQKVISKVSKIGYYNFNNNPNNDCSLFELIYQDTSSNIRYLTDKNKLFYDTAYYSYIGKSDLGNHVYILKDGLMVYDVGNNKTNLSDGNYHIKYLGSFYTLNGNKEDIYIIDTNGYVYKIEDFNEESATILKRVSNEPLKRIGARIITNAQSFATEKYTVLIEFTDNEVLEINDAYAYEYLG